MAKKDTKKIFKLDKVLLGLTILLFAFGAIMILSSSNVSTFFRYDETFYHFLKQQLLILFGALLIFPFAIRVPLKRYREIGIIVFLLVLAMLVAVLLQPGSTNNAKSWFILGKFRFQPSEAAKIVYILLMAFYYEKYKEKLNIRFYAFLPLVIGAVLTLLVVMQPDLGTAFILMIISLAMFFINPVKKTFKTFVGVNLFLMFILLLISFKTGMLTKAIGKDKIARFNTKAPCSKENFEYYGNQLCNSYIAINNGKIKGAGITKSTQKYLYLAESHTDFIFPIIVEETGFIGGGLVILALTILVIRIIILGNLARTSLEKNICYGVFIYLASHIILNLGGVMGIIPMTGVPLPFLSYGGSFALSVSAALILTQIVAINNYPKLKKK